MDTDDHDAPQLTLAIAAAHRPRRLLAPDTVPADVSADRAPAYPRYSMGLVPSALHTVGQYANNPIEADHGG